MRPASPSAASDEIDIFEVEKLLLAGAEAASRITLPRFRTAMVVENKWIEGFDPVTEADREAELAIRTLIGERFPHHGVIGEEWDRKRSESPHEWIIDPIDGTRAFIAGIPVWGTLIGFMKKGRAIAGLMSQPFTGETFLGLPGGTRYRRGGEEVVLRTSSITELGKAKLSTTTPDMFVTSGTHQHWEALRLQVLQTRYGLDCYAYCMLAAGHLDLVVETNLKNVDIAPLVPVIENAGGVVMTWSGGPAEEGGNCIAASTMELAEAAKAALSAG